jgi:hypothetical protein
VYLVQAYRPPFLSPLDLIGDEWVKDWSILGRRNDHNTDIQPSTEQTVKGTLDNLRTSSEGEHQV